MNSPKSQLIMPSVVAITLLLTGCYDKTEDIIMMHNDGNPVRCPSQQNTVWEFVAPVTVGNKIVYVIRDERLAKKPTEHIRGQLLLGYLAGGRVPWVQFSVSCGESKELFFRTPELSVEDLVKNEDRGYIYFVNLDALHLNP